MAAKKKKKVNEKVNQRFKIDRFTRDIIHGYIMGDGYIRAEGNLTIDQSTQQIEFVEWMWQRLALIRTNEPHKPVKRRDPRNGNVTYSQRFFTRNVLKGFFRMWKTQNPTGKFTKSGNISYLLKLPKSIKCFFNSTVISVWYAGDGTLIQGSLGAKIEVTAFSAEDRVILVDLFKTKHGINATIAKAGFSKTGTQQWTLNIGSADYPRFKTLITQNDLISTCFPDKLY